MAVFLILVVLIFIFVTQPLTTHRRPKVEDSQALSALLAERDRLLNSLQELDFDNSLGKIPPGTYPQQRASLVQQGAEVLRQIDDLAPVSEVQPTAAGNQEDRVEAILAARRASLAAGNVPVEDEVESLIGRRRKARTGKSSIFCSHCGRPLSASDRFCPRCGQPVK